MRNRSYLGKEVAWGKRGKQVVGKQVETRGVEPPGVCGELRIVQY